MMKIDFVQMKYGHTDASYDISGTVLKPLTKELNAVNKTIDHYEKLWKGDDFTLLIYLFSKQAGGQMEKIAGSLVNCNSELVEVLGPRVCPKSRTVECYIYIPYKTFPQFTDEISYILDSIAEGISMVLRKYKVDPSGIPEAVGKVKKLIIESDNPEKFEEKKNSLENMATEIVAIYPEEIPPGEKQFDTIFYCIAENVDDELIQRIIEHPRIHRIQIYDYIPAPVLCRLDKVFIKRPEISFGVFGFGRENFNGWNLDFLRYMPNLQNLVLFFSENKANDFSILTTMDNLRGLSLEINDLKDYSFVKTLPEHLERLDIFREFHSGKVNFDCRWLLRFRNLHTLFLGEIDKNLECIVALKHLKHLKLRGISISDLSFLKHIPIEDLSIIRCRGAKIDFSTLSDLVTLRRLELFRISKLDDISFIGTLTGLEKLKLISLSNITKLPDLSGLNHLAEVRIDTLNKLTDITGLLKVKNLKSLKMESVKSMTRESVYAVLDNQSIEVMQCFGGRSETDYILIDRKNESIY